MEPEVVAFIRVKVEKLPSYDAFFETAPDDVRAAIALDGAIAERLARKERNLAADYLAVGRGLVEMQNTRSFRHVGYPTFEGYLAARPAFGRTYYSYLIRLGRARDLEPLPPGIGGAQLVEYAKATDYPELVGRLIGETWDDLRGHTIRRMAAALRLHVEAQGQVYRRPGRGSTAWRRPGIVHRVATLLDRLGPEERGLMLEALDEVLAGHRAR
jgi:hypothetical protein